MDMHRSSVYKLRELFNLPTYEADVYLALLNLKQATVNELMQESTVPRGKIYEALNSLKRGGLISTLVFSRPRVYSLTTPRISAKRIIEQNMAKLNERLDWFNKFVEDINKTTTSGEREIVAEIIRGRDNEHEYFDMMRKQARKYIHHATSIEGLKRAYARAEKKPNETGSKINDYDIIIKTIAPYSKESLEIAKKLQKTGRVNIRLIKKSYFFAAYIVDDIYCLSAIGLRDNMEDYERDATLLYAESRQLAKALNISFMSLWEQGVIIDGGETQSHS